MLNTRWLNPDPPAVAAFQTRHPFPWQDFDGFLEEEAFQELRRTFPSRARFELHRGLRRGGGQRSHDRYYLAYEQSPYHRRSADMPDDSPGVIHHHELAPAWQRFLADLQSAGFLAHLEGRLGQRPRLRFAWHLSFEGSEVSPHLDSAGKLGTHIFYFNDADDWDDAWGGRTLLLADKRTERPNPEFSEFGEVLSPSMLGNRSLLFQRTPTSWHGVERLSCPRDHYRKTFHVIAER